MGRKRSATFEWTAEGVEGDAPREGEREDRKALKARLAVAEKLVKRMAALGPAKRARLPVDEDTRAALEVLVNIRKGPGQSRQLAFVRGLLRDVDLDALAAAVDALAIG